VVVLGFRVEAAAELTARVRIVVEIPAFQSTRDAPLHVAAELDSRRRLCRQGHKFTATINQSIIIIIIIIIDIFRVA